MTRMCHPAYTLAAAGTAPGVERIPESQDHLSTLSSSLPATLCLFIPRPFPSFNHFITVAEKAPFLLSSFPPSLSLSVTILKIMHRNRKRKQGTENGSLKWPARESQGTGVNSLFRSPRVSAAWQPSCHWIFMWAQKNARVTTKCAGMGSKFPCATASPQRVSSGLPLILIWLHGETHSLMRLQLTVRGKEGGKSTGFNFPL